MHAKTRRHPRFKHPRVVKWGEGVGLARRNSVTNSTGWNQSTISLPHTGSRKGLAFRSITVHLSPVITPRIFHSFLFDPHTLRWAPHSLMSIDAGAAPQSRRISLHPGATHQWQSRPGFQWVHGPSLPIHPHCIPQERPRVFCFRV